MKRFVSAILVMLMAVSCLALAACGSGSSAPAESAAAPPADSQYIGFWKATKAEVKDDVVPADEVFEEGDYTLELRDDGTATVIYVDEENGTWQEIDNGVHVTAGETDTDFAYSDDCLILEILGVNVYFEKQ